MTKAILETQGYKEGKDFIRIKENLEIKSKVLIDKLKNTGLALNLKQLISLANIGPWPWYGKANYKAIELFIQLGVGRIINGGYSFNFDTHKKNLVHINEFKNILSKLSENGYDPEQHPPLMIGCLYAKAMD